MRTPATALVAFAVLASASLGCHDIHFDTELGSGDIGIYDDLYSVSVVDGKHAVAAGYWGSIFRTTDGGGTWTRVATGTKRLIYDVSMADTQTGWAVGQLGTILRTEDGGATWAAQPNVKVEQGTHLFGVHAIDANRAWVVGAWGTRLYTDDGGQSWLDESLTITEEHPQFVWLAPSEQTKVREGDKVFEDVGLNDVHCRPGSERCWITGEFGYIFFQETRAGGWQQSQIAADIEMDPVVMEYDRLDVSEGARARLATFSKQLASLAHLNVAIDPRLSAAEIEALADGDDPTPLFEILEARARNIQSIVEEAGILQDRMRTRGAPPWDYEDFMEDDPEFLTRYLTGRTHDHPGVLVSVAQNPYLFTVRFRDDQNGLVSGLGGVILRSEDGGRTWAYESTDRKQALFSVYASPQRAITVGEKGLIRVSTDGGRNWVPPNDFPSVFTFMRDLTFAPDHSTGFIVGEGGMILRSEDGGMSWNQVLPPPEADVET